MTVGSEDAGQHFLKSLFQWGQNHSDGGQMPGALARAFFLAFLVLLSCCEDLHPECDHYQRSANPQRSSTS